MHIRPIDTLYRGRLFRSRLEARWAVFLDALSIEWEYEREGYDLGKLGWYLPDFWLPQWGSYVEIKPDTYGDGALPADYQPILAALSERILMVLGTVGAPGSARFYLFVQGELAQAEARFPFAKQRPAYEVDRAVTAALSARFEHGERGRR